MTVSVVGWLEEFSVSIVVPSFRCTSDARLENERLPISVRVTVVVSRLPPFKARAWFLNYDVDAFPQQQRFLFHIIVHFYRQLN